MKLNFRTSCGLLALLLAGGIAQAQTAFDSFEPNPNGTVRVLAVQADGKLLVGGEFTAIGGHNRQRLARLHANGEVDLGFPQNDIDGAVRTVALQPDGKIIIGGSFNIIGGLPYARLARWHNNGLLDIGFNPEVANGTVQAVALQADGKIIIGGSFTEVVGQSRRRIARLNTDGSLDESFDPGASRPVRALAVQADGKILVGGRFLNIAGHARTSLARLNSDGSLDTGFDEGAQGNAPVNAIVVQADGKILIGGEFNRVHGEFRSRLARLRPDGGLDGPFAPVVSGSVWAVSVRPSDGMITIGGEFERVDGVDRNRLARLSRFGNLSNFYDPDVGGQAVYALAEQPGDKLAAGGNFQTLNGNTAIRFNLARLYHDGIVEDAFMQHATVSDGLQVAALAIQPDHKILVGGTFTEFAGQSRQNIVRLRPDGRLDPAFFSEANGVVHAIAVLPDRNILIGGTFSEASGQPRRNIALLSEIGLALPFDPDVNATVFAIAVQPDGKIIIGGGFTEVDGQPRARLARLHPDGSVDTDFNPPAINGDVYAVALKRDGSMIIGGIFTNIGGFFRDRIAQIRPDGRLAVFNPIANSSIFNLVVRPDDRLWAGGAFTIIAGQERRFLVLVDVFGNANVETDHFNSFIYGLAVQANGDLLSGGDFTGASNNIGSNFIRGHIARVSSDGGLLQSFRDMAANCCVRSLALQADGKLLAGGMFTEIDGFEQNRIARIAPREAAVESLTLDGSTVTWERGGSAPELLGPPELLFSNNGSTFDEVIAPAMARVGDAWTTAGFAPPVGQTFFLRARGRVGDGSSSGIVEHTRLFYVTPPPPEDDIFADRFELQP